MTSALRLDTLRLPAADPPTPSPLPILRGTGVRRGLVGADEEMTAQLGYGQPHTLLPYTMQDGYTRDRTERDLPVVVLENEHLTATFLPSYGGRLWSLVHRESGRELLHRNPILQPANLALRDAWFAGGVEWNLGATGHWPLTCSPLHAVRLARPDGTPVLRMYEFERMRRLVVRIDAWLPEDSPVLMVEVTLTNPSADTVPAYWWSNIAVPEAEGVRVLAPASRAYHFDYTEALRLVDFPVLDGVDRSYTTGVPTAADYFFDLPAGARPWIAALDGEGKGLVQASTGLLRGRKLFHWGTGQGGARWQEWLSGPSAPYLEIQAGLARTQLEHVPMPGGAEWSWVEAYGLLEVDPALVHGPWEAAVSAASAAVERLGPLTPSGAVGEAEVLSRGSAWGALEDLGVDFGELGAEQLPWRELLDTGRLPVSDPPAAPVTGQRWLDLLEKHPADWHARYHLGLLRYALGDLEGASVAWQESLGLCRTPWALRCVAESARLAGGRSADLLLEAHALAPSVVALSVETVRALVADDRCAEALTVIDALGDEQRALGRMRLLEAQAALGAQDLDRVEALLNEGIVVDNLREGEDSLDSLWFRYQELRNPGQDPAPLPESLDFRMH
ncbi:DUF5107 domain-containing protein [Nonomuraea sp. NPDC050556]|uniref:DUF5107 domain-containing protein n=1 Tax=Nonomuraea sp. NPDC050556 TaxID=3364369 RepID=UPI0037B59276